MCFSLSHLPLQLSVTGCEAGAFLEYVTVADVQSLKDNAGCYTVLPNEGGGIIDDAIVNKVNDGHFYVVANAGCADKDLRHLTVSGWCWPPTLLTPPSNSPVEDR